MKLNKKALKAATDVVISCLFITFLALLVVAGIGVTVAALIWLGTLTHPIVAATAALLILILGLAVYEYYDVAKRER